MATGKADNAGSHNASAWTLHRQQHYAEAIEEFRKSIELDANNPDAYNGWGWALYGWRKYPEAIEKLQKSIDLKSDNSDSYKGWGWVLYGQRRYPEAIEKFQKSIELKSDEHYSYNGWGLALFGQRKYAEAIEKFRRAVELKGEFTSAYLGWGTTLAEQYRYDEAIEKYHEALNIDPDFAYAYHNIGFYLFKQGRYRDGGRAWEEARRAYERTIQKARQRRDADVYRSYGTALHQVFGDLNEAERVLEEGLGFDNENTAILSALVSVKLDQKEQGLCERSLAHSMARESYRKAERLLKERLQQGDDALTLRELAELLLKMEGHTEAEQTKFSQAEKYLLRSRELDDEAAAVYVDLGVVYSRREDYKRAAQYFAHALCRSPDNLSAWSNLAEAYSKQKLSEEAEAEYQKILRIASEHVESHIGLAQVYIERGDEAKDEETHELAINHLSKAIEIGQPAKGSAIPRASKILKKKELAGALYSRGYARVRRFEALKAKTDLSLLREAREDFRKCFELDPDHHRARRAIEKLDERLEWFSPHWLTEKVGPYLILSLLLTEFGISQVTFFVGWPVRIQAAAYVTLTLSSLVFIVIALYLPQILKLKVAGIELEKSAVDQIRTSDALGIARPQRERIP